MQRSRRVRRRLVAPQSQVVESAAGIGAGVSFPFLGLRAFGESGLLFGLPLAVS